MLASACVRRRQGRWLVVIPLSLAAILLLLMMPRSTEPDEIPLPRVDARVIRAIEAADDARAAAAERERLAGYILAVGSAFRAINALDLQSSGDETEKIDARRQLESAVRDLPHHEGVEGELLSLRALQVRRFVDAIASWEATGATTTDLKELGGTFVQRIEDAGWVVGGRVLFEQTSLRVAFKLVWNTLVGVDNRPAFALTLDEQRALYTFYLEHPRPPEAYRASLALDREAATTPEACARVNREHARQLEVWRAEKIKRLGAIDPAYPTGYALGVSYYRAGRYELASEAFATFAAAHKDGPYALRAKNHLKAALLAPGPL
jgi:hypothetical protein